MNLNDIEYVVKIAETKKFTTAAEELYITQSALSQAIKKLEKELGVTLFARKRSEVILTDAGRLFLEDAQVILSHTEHLQHQLNSLCDMETGTLRIGIAPIISQFYLGRPLAAFRKKYPNIKIVIYEDLNEPLEKLLFSGKVDMLLVSLPLTDTQLECIPLINEETFLAIPNDHPMNKIIPPGPDGYGHVRMQDFKDDSYIMVNPEQHTYLMGMDACHRAGFEPDIVFQTDYINTANAMVSAGIGISFVPYMVFSTRNDNGGNMYYHIDNAEMTKTIGVMYENQMLLSLAAKEFINILKEYYQSISD